MPEDLGQVPIEITSGMVEAGVDAYIAHADPEAAGLCFIRRLVEEVLEAALSAGRYSSQHPTRTLSQP